MSEYAPLIVDLVIVGIISISALLAYARGFVREFLTIAAVAVAVAGSYYLFTRTEIAGFARQWVTNELVADGITVVASFLVVLILTLLITHPLSEKVRGSNLGFLDRWLGFAWGAIRGSLIVAILYVPLAVALPAAIQPTWVREARLIPYVEMAGSWLVSLVPMGMRDRDGITTETPL